MRWRGHELRKVEDDATKTIRSGSKEVVGEVKRPPEVGITGGIRVGLQNKVSPRTLFRVYVCILN